MAYFHNVCKLFEFLWIHALRQSQTSSLTPEVGPPELEYHLVPLKGLLSELHMMEKIV